MIDEYLHGSGDIHSLTAKHCFPVELDGIDVKDIKHLRPDLRTKAKPVEFSQQFEIFYTILFYLSYKKDRFEPFISNNKSKQDELLEPCDGNQQPSQPLTKLEGSETNS